MDELNYTKPGAPKGVLHLLWNDIILPENVGFSDEINTIESENDEYNRYFLTSLSHYGYKPKLHLVQLTNYKQIIRDEIGDPNTCNDLILHLCDGTETDGFVGASLSEYLAKEGYSFAGATAEFSRICSDKHVMKDLFKKNDVSTSPYINITKWNEDIKQEIIDKNMKYPLFVKVGNGYGSIGLSRQSIVKDFDEVRRQVMKILSQYDKVILEEFLLGSEYSVLVFEDKGEVKAYRPVQKNFHHEDPYDRFLSFKTVWEDYRWAYSYSSVDNQELEQKIMEMAIKAFKSCNGNSFARVDIRRRDETGEIFVLEINDSCALGPATTSEYILNMCQETTEMFVEKLLKNSKRYTIPKKNGTL